MANTFSRRLYDHMPPLLQSGVLNAYGLNTRRRLGQWGEILARLESSERWEPAEQQRYVTERLRDLLSHAVRHVPRYSDLVSLLGDIEDPATPVFEILASFPPVTREEIVADPDAFVSRAFDRRRLIKTVTSGTTGTPFATWIEPKVVVTSDALWWRRTLWAGYEAGDWIARLVGDPVIPLADRRPRPVYRLSWVDKRIYFSTYHLSDETAPRIVDCLRKRKPAFLMGYPSALDALARLASGKADLSAWTPRAILFSSEPMYEHQREAVTQLVRAPIRGLYGCAERIISAAQCKEGSYHLGLVDGFVEGQFGEAPLPGATRVTGLLNHAMPLIRYELGDTVEPLTGQKCTCGRTLPLISPVVTKREDSLTTPSGRVISSSILTWAFKDLDGVRKSQIIQVDDTSIQVVLQAAPPDFERVEPVLQGRLRELVFDELAMTFRRVDVLDAVTSSGKTRFVLDARGRPSSPSESAGVQGTSDRRGSR
jgi:phenylacetate-CoA ligase